MQTASFRSRSLASARTGSTLIETVIAVTLFATVLLSSIALVESGRRFSSSTMQITTVEDLAQQMLFHMEGELSSATGVAPKLSLPGALGAGEVTSMAVSSTAGFPPHGSLLLDRGTSREERLSYASIAGPTSFAGLSRGEQCTLASDHPGADGVDQLWCGLAEPLENQLDPSPGEYDGRTLEQGSPVYFRGDGTGFSYRVPIDPSGGNNPLNGHDLFWGAVLPGVGPTTSGWMALVFEAKDSYSEATGREDINADGDQADVFDIGQIRRLAWDASDPGQVVEDIGLGPTNVIQERCHAGGDLDGDGYGDPIFLWNGATDLLHVRLFLLAPGTQGMPVVREVESVMFLRNEPEL